jgi:hypothetical protein
MRNFGIDHSLPLLLPIPAVARAGAATSQPPNKAEPIERRKFDAEARTAI